MTKRGVRALWILALAPLAGCVNVKAPDKIIINRPETVDSSRVPQINTVEEGRIELDKAYGRIQRLEDENAQLARENERLRRERR